MTWSSTWSSLLRSLRSLGNAGAVANAHRACEEPRLTEARIDALATRLGPVGPRPAVVETAATA